MNPTLRPLGMKKHVPTLLLMAFSSYQRSGGALWHFTASNFCNIISMGINNSTPQVQRLDHDSTSSTHNTTSTSSNFEDTFNAALVKYANPTGHDLRNHPLASRIHHCDSPDKILAVPQVQAKEFDDFGNDEPKLMKWLKPVVSRLHTLSTTV